MIFCGFPWLRLIYQNVKACWGSVECQPCGSFELWSYQRTDMELLFPRMSRQRFLASLRNGWSLSSSKQGGGSWQTKLLWCCSSCKNPWLKEDHGSQGEGKHEPHARSEKEEEQSSQGLQGGRIGLAQSATSWVLLFPAFLPHPGLGIRISLNLPVTS